MRTYIRFKYEYNPVKDSEYYKHAAYLIKRSLMRKFDSEDPIKANDSFGEICVSTKVQMTVNEIKKIVAYLWSSTISQATGSYNGFMYRDLRPESFTVSVEEVWDKDLLQTAKDVIAMSDNIVECFAMQDINRVFNTYNSRKRLFETSMKTIADCL